MTCIMFRDIQRRLHRLRIGHLNYDFVFVERRYLNNRTLGVEVFQWLSGAKGAPFRKFCTLTANLEGETASLQGDDTAYINVHSAGGVLLKEMRRLGIAYPTGTETYRDGRPYPLYKFNLQAMGSPAPERGRTLNG